MHEIAVQFIAQFRRKYGLQCVAVANLDRSSESKLCYISSGLFSFYVLISSLEIYILTIINNTLIFLFIQILIIIVQYFNNIIRAIIEIGI